MSENWVLKEDEAIELLALLISSARIQMDEPAHYGPLRLLTATERLSNMIVERSSDKSRGFCRAISSASRICTWQCLIGKSMRQVSTGSAGQSPSACCGIASLRRAAHERSGPAQYQDAAGRAGDDGRAGHSRANRSHSRCGALGARGGNLRPNRFIVIEDPETRRLIRLVSPGMFQQAPVLILICTNMDVAAEHNLPLTDRAS